MQRIAFPRLYVPPEEELKLPRITVTYHGKRSMFGPGTVYRVEKWHELVSKNDWRGDEAALLARDLICDLFYWHDDPEEDEAFAREVLAKLPGDTWELPAQDIRNWHRRWGLRSEEAKCNYPPAFDPDEELPGPEDEARMLELVMRIGRES